MKKSVNIQKTVVGILLIVTLVLLSACSPETNSSDNSAGDSTGELVFWTPFGGGDYEFMKSLVDDYNATNPDYTVEIVSKEWGTYYQGVNGALISESGPDVFVTHQSKLAELIPTQKLSDIKSIEAGVDWSTYNQSQIDAVTFNEIQYSIPLDTHALVMFYNNDILERANITKEDLSSVADLDSWNQILEDLSQVIEDNEHVLDIANSGENTVQQFWAWNVLNGQLGGKYIEDGEAVLNQPAGVQALEILIDWNEQGYLKNGIDDGSSYDIFKSGDAAINWTGVWATGNYEGNEDLNFGVMPIPGIVGEQKTWGDSHTFAIPNYIDENRKVAAMAFADWVNENAVTWAKAGHVPVKPSVLESDAYLELPYRSDYKEVLDLVEYYPESPLLWSANDMASIKVNEGFLGKYSAKEALDLAKKEIDQLIGK